MRFITPALALALAVPLAGCGAIGTQLGVQLQQAGYRVIGLRRSAVASPFPLLQADFTAPLDPGLFNEPIHYVVHTATPGELLVERMVKELKRPGRAAGGGFYDYPAGQKKVLWPELKTRFEKADVVYSQQDIKDRLLYRQAVETARCLQEGVLTSVHDGNIGSIFGIGFPAWTGGALQYVNNIGAAKFVARADALAKKYGERFAPPKLLRDKAAKGESLI